MSEEIKQIPVFVFSGFMDSGKTTLVRESLYSKEVTDGYKTLLICTEEGGEEYDNKILLDNNVTIIYVDDEDKFNLELLNQLHSDVNPDQVFIEYNGTWDIKSFLEGELPEGWLFYQNFSLVNAETYDMYLMNMRQLIMTPIVYATTVIFNRCSDDTEKGRLRRSIKVLNGNAKIIFERENGDIDNRPEELDIDLNKDELDITDDMFGNWIVDCKENPDKYIGKMVNFVGIAYNKPNLPENYFGLGRNALVCCAEDARYIGFLCEYPEALMPEHGEWVKVKAKVVNKIYAKTEEMKVMLQPISVEPAPAPDDEYIYF